MSSIAIWITVSAQEYDLLPITLENAIRSVHVSKIIIIHTGSHLPSNANLLAGSFDKVDEYSENFGDGYDRSISEGGYDQVAARNFALSIVEKTGAEWLMQLDADDYYDPVIFEIVCNLPEIYDVVLSSCINLLSINEYWDKKQAIIDGTIFIDPHIRIWRSNLKKRFQMCENAKKLYLNHSRHCGVDFSYHPAWKIYNEKKFVHFHLHGILRKRNTLKWLNERVYIDIFDYEGLNSCIKKLPL